MVLQREERSRFVANFLAKHFPRQCQFFCAKTTTFSNTSWLEVIGRCRAFRRSSCLVYLDDFYTIYFLQRYLFCILFTSLPNYFTTYNVENHLVKVSSVDGVQCKTVRLASINTDQFAVKLTFLQKYLNKLYF